MRTKIISEQFNFMLSMLRDTEAASIEAASTGADSILVAGVCCDQPDSKYVEIELSKNDLRVVGRALGIAFLDVGMNKDGEINETGYRIEKASDAFSDGKISD